MYTILILKSSFNILIIANFSSNIKKIYVNLLAYFPLEIIRNRIEYNQFI